MKVSEKFIHPFSPAGRVNPYPAYRWLREHQPVYYDAASRMWLLTRHADCSTALRDPRFSAALGQQERVRDDDLPTSMLTTDAAEHDRLRTPGTLLLGPAAVREHMVNIEREADLLLDRQVERSELEVIVDLAEPFAAGVLAEVLRIPHVERQRFTELARRVSVNLDPLAGADAAANGTAAMGQLHAYLDVHVSRLANAAPAAPIFRLSNQGQLTRTEVVTILSLCVVGGFEPLINLIGNALTLLLPLPTLLERLRHGDEEVARALVDEVLRLESPIPFTARVTTADVDLGASTLPAGSPVLAILAAANRDPQVFPAPDELVIGRRPNPQLAFGTGPHFCLAASLVRHAGSVMLAKVVRRYPRLNSVDPSVAPTRRRSLVPRGVVALPVRLG